MARAASKVTAVPPGGWGMPTRLQRALQRSRSSARSIDSGVVPRTSPAGSRPASLSGVCPPRETITPATVPVAASTSMTLLTSSQVTGSKYRRSLVS